MHVSETFGAYVTVRSVRRRVLLNLRNPSSIDTKINKAERIRRTIEKFHVKVILETFIGDPIALPDRGHPGTSHGTCARAVSSQQG